MSATATRFYVTGGTLRPDAPSYVERQADIDLYAGLIAGDFCYVLTARQMGKSSLMARTAVRLRREGIAVAVLDLTAVGQNLSPEQWYGGLLERLGEQLDLEDELEEFWLTHERLGPLQRWMASLREIVLVHVAGRIVLFVDEIDVVQSLPFATDEFFAAIRECYNRRTEDPELTRLTFCLLGVATPSDLIRDTRMTPFNIGRRIEPNDFSTVEAAPLAHGLGRTDRMGKALLARVLHWTGGHPYLTQRLCQAVAEDVDVTDAAGVDRHCQGLFLAPRAREQDDNLLFVRERLLRSEADPASLLDLYGQVRRGKRVLDDETNPLVSLLQLSGIVRVVAGNLSVRNRIYAGVFDPAWARANMPDAEVRRQRVAFRRGLLRAAIVAGVILAAMAILVLFAVRQARYAQQQTRVARRDLYVADMGLAQQAAETGDPGRVVELLEAQRPEPERVLAASRGPREAVEFLEAQRPQPGREDVRGFEWRYLWRAFHENNPFNLRGHTEEVCCVAFSPDGKTLATASSDQTVKLWDLATGREAATLRGHTNAICSVVFSPDGRALATTSDDNTVKLWEVAAAREIATLRGPEGPLSSAVFSPDGRSLATRSSTGKVTLWNLATKRAVAAGKAYGGFGTAVAFSRDGKILATASVGGGISLWDVGRMRETAHLTGGVGTTASIAFSPNGKMLAAGGDAGKVALWNIATKRRIARLTRHQGWSISRVLFQEMLSEAGLGPFDLLRLIRARTVLRRRWGSGLVTSIGFSPDGKALATGGDDGTVTLWNLATKRETVILEGHTDRITSVVFSPDGKTLATGSRDKTVKLWGAATRAAALPLLRHRKPVNSLAFSPDSKTLATGSDDGIVQLWDVATKSLVAVLQEHRAAVTCVAFTSNGVLLATGGLDSTVKLWDVATKNLVATIKGGIGRIVSLASSADGKTLAIESMDGKVKLWDITTRREVDSLNSAWEGGGRANSLAFRPDDRTLAMAEPGSVTLWHLAPRRSVSFGVGAEGRITCVAFSPSGRTLVGGSDDQTVTVWDNVPPWEQLWERDAQRVHWAADLRFFNQASLILQSHGGPVSAAAFCPDGKTLATGSGDSLIKLWNTATWHEVGTLKGHKGPVTSVAFSSDGNTLASAGSDATVRLWRAAPFAETDAPGGSPASLH